MCRLISRQRVLLKPWQSADVSVCRNPLLPRLGLGEESGSRGARGGKEIVEFRCGGLIGAVETVTWKNWTAFRWGW
ncbi:hypothetical protein Tco_0569298 [Tanacetum coccineum]